MATPELLRRYRATAAEYGEDCLSARILRRELERRVSPEPKVPETDSRAARGPRPLADEETSP